MEPEDFRPIPTCEIPPPVLESDGPAADADGGLPRVLAQAAGSQAHSRRLLLIAAAFVLVSAVEVLLLYRLPSQPLVVYQEPAVQVLVEELP